MSSYVFNKQASSSYKFNLLLWQVSISKKTLGLCLLLVAAANVLPSVSSFQNPKPQEHFPLNKPILESSSWHINPNAVKRMQENNEANNNNWIYIHDMGIQKQQENCLSVDLTENQTKLLSHDCSLLSVSLPPQSARNTSTQMKNARRNDRVLSFTPRHLTWAIHLIVCMGIMGFFLGPAVFGGVVLLSAGMIKLTGTETSQSRAT